MRVLLCALAGVLVLAAPAVAKPPAGEWLAGDLHVHTCFSHDVWCGPDDDNTGIEDANTLGHSVGDDFLLAGLRGLDYLAITDHNDIRSQSDPGFGADGVIPVPGYENSLHGHAQMLGARRLYDNGDSGTAAVTALADALRADGGVFQANHPSDPVWGYGYDVPLDTVEVWTLPRFYQEPFPSNSDNDQAVRYWQGWLDRGAHVTANRGSDSPRRVNQSPQGGGKPPPGGPPTPSRGWATRRRGSTRARATRTASSTACAAGAPSSRGSRRRSSRRACSCRPAPGWWATRPRPRRVSPRASRLRRVRWCATSATAAGSSTG